MEIPEQSSSPSVKAYDFSDLPLEIIHHILMVGPCESAIALSLVNKRFKSICSTPLVYLEIIEDKLQHDPKWRGKRTIPWHNIAGVHLEDDYRKSVRWALADSRARASSADNNVALSGKPLELLRWEPYLLAVNREHFSSRKYSTNISQTQRHELSASEREQTQVPGRLSTVKRP